MSATSPRVLASGLRDVVDAVEEDLGRPPRLVELLEILRDGARTLPEGALADAHPDEIKSFVERPRARARDTTVVGELNDNAYAVAAAAFHHWWQTGSGAPISAADLAPAILDALRHVGSALLEPPEVARLTAITVQLRRAKARARIADILAVPTGDAGYHLVVLVCRNRFGAGFGVIGGRYPLRTPPGDLAPAATGIVRYSDEEAIASGRWRIVGADERLLRRFPAEPEIYHRPQPPIPGVPRIGEFGAAETPAGRLRDLTAAEARIIDLQGYPQVSLHEQFESLLADLSHRPGG
ncbi:hypothetical protein AB0J80_21980 [Actinoplanes sp. NPDC049548]|uniref:hypothetical protein n=1 Tax=Actinoplanes sp. NPDC049548 TaxID=3155152 RepID=UPI00341772F6